MRYLHTMLRVVDLERSLRFYTEVLGLRLQSRKDYPDGKFTLAFLGHGDGDEPFLELTHNWETKTYDKGNGYGHMAFAVPDAAEACRQAALAGGNVVRPAGPMKGGTTVIAFLEDPDGYKVELIERR
jgi:lactoylglutathione lyase